MEYKPPVEKGEKYNLKCESIAAKGDGVCKIENYVIIVPGMQVEEVCQIEITHLGKRNGFGKIVD